MEISQRKSELDAFVGRLIGSGLPAIDYQSIFSSGRSPASMEAIFDEVKRNKEELKGKLVEWNGRGVQRTPFTSTERVFMEEAVQSLLNLVETFYQYRDAPPDERRVQGIYELPEYLFYADPDFGAEKFSIVCHRGQKGLLLHNNRKSMSPNSRAFFLSGGHKFFDLKDGSQVEKAVAWFEFQYNQKHSDSPLSFTLLSPHFQGCLVEALEGNVTGLGTKLIEVMIDAFAAKAAKTSAQDNLSEEVKETVRAMIQNAKDCVRRAQGILPLKELSEADLKRILLLMHSDAELLNQKMLAQGLASLRHKPSSLPPASEIFHPDLKLFGMDELGMLRRVLENPFVPFMKNRLDRKEKTIDAGELAVCTGVFIVLQEMLTLTREKIREIDDALLERDADTRAVCEQYLRLVIQKYPAGKFADLAGATQISLAQGETALKKHRRSLAQRTASQAMATPCEFSLNYCQASGLKALIKMIEELIVLVSGDLPEYRIFRLINPLPDWLAFLKKELASRESGQQ